MRVLIATIVKELIILSRDRTGLIVLFLMPAVLVVVISLVQENVMKVTGQTNIRVLFVDQDKQALGKMIEELLRSNGSLEIVSDLDDAAINESSAKDLLADGKYQFCVVIPSGMTETMKAAAARQVEAAFQPDSSGAGHDISLARLTVYFDPMIQGSFRSAVENALRRVILSLEMELKARAFSEIIPLRINRAFEEMGGISPPGGVIPPLSPDWGRERITEVSVLGASHGKAVKLPTPAQQNVPAWALFGMFFIVIPLGGSLIEERRNGTLARLLTLPAPYIVVLAGKVAAYVLVCICQFGLVLLVGKYVLPLLGSQILEIDASLPAILAVVGSASLAAAGYGVMLGIVARTYEQLSMFGAVSIVIAAALGGIMVPVYVMPELMQRISEFSPLAWGMNALTDLFARSGNLRSVAPEMTYLNAFFLVNLIIAWRVFVRRGRSGGAAQ